MLDCSCADIPARPIPGRAAGCGRLGPRRWRYLRPAYVSQTVAARRSDRLSRAGNLHLPSPDAFDVYPSEHGEFYDYQAKKYWRVEKVLEDGSIVAVTPLMEHQHLQRNDPNLRKANLIERLRYAARFPSPVYR